MPGLAGESIGSAEGASDPLEQPATPIGDGGPRPPTLLVIDDDPTVVRFIETVAGRLGFETVVATSVAEAKVQLDEVLPDVVICDLNLGTGTGIDVLEHVAGLDQVGDVILTSGCDIRVLRTTANLGRQLGLNVRTVLPKPIRVPLLQRALSTVPRRLLPLTVADIDQAIAEHAFQPYFQPQIEQAGGRLVGAEALARWRHADRGIVSPASFVPLAEQEGRLGAITSAVMRSAFDWCRASREMTPDLRVSVNVPPSLVTQPGFAPEVEALAAAAGLQPEHVVLEITESSPLTDTPDVIGVLSRLRIRGFGLALDDFGTGYSTLVGLHRMPFSELKVDQSFVREIAADADARQIVKATISLAHALGLATVVEGVEDAESLAIVRDLGADIVQGYHYSQALSPADFTLWAEQHRAEGADGSITRQDAP